MKDQVDGLSERGIAARFINSSQTSEEQAAALDEAHRGEIDLLYVAPERFRSHQFNRALTGLNIALFAIDEAHCISEWGHDFRPAYLQLSCIKAEFQCPVIALTATATRPVLKEIVTSLGLDNPVSILRGFERPNLTFSVEHIRGDKARVSRLGTLLHQYLGEGRAIVYAATRKRAKAVASALTIMGFTADHYHAGRTDGARVRAQQRFEDGKTRVLVATNAFGMGVDLPDIRIVVHIEAPGTLEGYYQEAGRAGRDGQPAWTTLLYSPKDALTRARLRGTSPPPGAEAPLDPGDGALPHRPPHRHARRQHVVPRQRLHPGDRLLRPAHHRHRLRLRGVPAARLRVPLVQPALGLRRRQGRRPRAERRRALGRGLDGDGRLRRAAQPVHRGHPPPRAGDRHRRCWCISCCAGDFPHERAPVRRLSIGSTALRLRRQHALHADGLR